MPPVKKNRFTIIPEDSHTQGMRILSIEEENKEEKKSKKLHLSIPKQLHPLIAAVVLIAGVALVVGIVSLVKKPESFLSSSMERIRIPWV